MLRTVFEAVAKVKAARGRPFDLPETLSGDTRLDELGIDSMSIAEVVDVIEERFDCELPFDKLLLVESVDEFIDVVCAPSKDVEK